MTDQSPIETSRPKDSTNPRYSRREFLKISAGLLLPSPESPRRQLLWQEGDLTPPHIRNYIENLIQNPPQIGGPANKYVPLQEGFGWATYWAQEQGPTSITTILNRIRILKRNPSLSPYSQLFLEVFSSQEKLPEIIKIINNILTDTQSSLSPQQSMESGKYIGFLAPRGGWGAIGMEMLVWLQKDPNLPIRFLGTALVVDNSGHWQRHQNWRYPIGPWKNSGYDGQGLEWIADASHNIKKQCLSPDQQGNQELITSRGQPGLILISKERFLALHDQPLPSSPPL